MKGIEDLPLKYIAMLIVAILIVSALISIANMVAQSSVNATEGAGSTLSTVLDVSIGNILNSTPSP